MLEHEYFTKPVNMTCGVVCKLDINESLYDKDGPLIIDTKNWIKYFRSENVDQQQALLEKDTIQSYFSEAEKCVASDEFDWFTTNNMP